MGPYHTFVLTYLLNWIVGKSDSFNMLCVQFCTKQNHVYLNSISALCFFYKDFKLNEDF